MATSSGAQTSGMPEAPPPLFEDLKQILVDHNGLAIWELVGNACGRAVGAEYCEVYVYNRDRHILQRVEEREREFVYGLTIHEDDPHIVADAIRQTSEHVLFANSEGVSGVQMAAPVFNLHDYERRIGWPLAVVVLDLPRLEPSGLAQARARLTTALNRLWPLGTYASILPNEIHKLPLQLVLETAVTTLCDKLGFGFAIINLVEEEWQEVCAVQASASVPAGWIRDAHHSIDSTDIQAAALRIAEPPGYEVISGWDERFDRGLFDKNQHERLVRVWVPLGVDLPQRIGTIEAGFDVEVCPEIPQLLIDILRHFARDLTTAIRNAQLYEREQLQAETLAWLYEATRLNTLGMDEVLVRGLERLERLEAVYAQIYLLDDETNELRRLASFGERPNDVPDIASQPLSSEELPARVLRSAQVEMVESVPRAAVLDGAASPPSVLRLDVPLGSIGVLEVGLPKRGRNRSLPLALQSVSWYARDLTLAIQKAALYERERRYAATLARLHQAGMQLRIAPREGDWTDRLRHIAQAARDVLEADIVMLYPVVEDDTTPAGRTRFGQPVFDGLIHDADRWSVRAPNDGDNVMQRIADKRQPYFRSDAGQDPLLSGPSADHVSRRSKHRNRPGSRTFAVRQGVESFAGVPLVADEKLLGVLCVNYRERHYFSQNEKNLTELLAQQAASVILSDRLVRERERKRLELDLHDTVKNKLAGLILLADRLGREVSSATGDPMQQTYLINRCKQAVREVLLDIDSVLDNLAAPRDADVALSDSLNRTVERVKVPPPPQIERHIDSGLPRLSVRAALNLTYVVDQAVMNAIQHADARTISVSARRRNGTVRIEVVDDGAGLATQAIDRRWHRGLMSMQERVRRLGGVLEIRSAPGRGTTICIDLPVRHNR